MVPVLQSESSECGLACLAMVLAYHGVVTDLATLRARHAISLKGMTLATLSRLAQDEHLGFRALRLELEDIGGLRLPAILHWDLNHFVVLKSIAGGRVTVHDPDSGERRYSMEEISSHFTGVALELWPDPGFQTPYWQAVAKYLSSYGLPAPSLIEYDKLLSLISPIHSLRISLK